MIQGGRKKRCRGRKRGKDMSSFLKIGIFIIAELFLSQVVNLLFKMLSKKNRAVHLRFFNSMINVLITVIMIYTLAQQFEVTKDLSTALLQSGSLIVAIATFAAQQALSNVISGFSLSVSRPYNVNDKIKVVQGGNIIAEGIVKDITIRHTIISQYNGESCIVPNSVMDMAVITNTNFTADIGNFLEIAVAYDSDIEGAMSIMQKICVENELTLNTEKNKVFVKGYSADGVILKTTIWTKNLDDSFQACSDIRIRLVEEFRKNGIEIPYQTVTICTGNRNEAEES